MLVAEPNSSMKNKLIHAYVVEQPVPLVPRLLYVGSILLRGVERFF